MALEHIEKIDGIDYYTTIQRARDNAKSKVHHLEQKLEQLKNSTRHDEADMKMAIKDVKAQVSEANVELAKHQAILDKVDAILAEVDIQE